MKTALFLSLALLFSLATATAQLTINGTITAPDGTTPRFAQVSLTPPSPSRDEKIQFIEVVGGKFSVSVPKAGLYQLSVNAPNAKTITIPVIITEGDQSLKVDVSLISLFPADIQSVKIIINKKSSEMTKEADGSYSFVATATGDTLAYQLELNGRGHTHNGTQSDYFVYDGGGDFYSVLRVKAGSPVKIAFEPQKALRSPEGALPKVKWDNAFLTKFSELSEKSAQARRNASAAFMQARGSGQPFAGYNYGTLTKELETIANDASQKLELRQFAAIALLGLPFTTVEKSFTSNLLNLVPIGSPMWAIAPNLPSRLTQLLYGEDLSKAIDLLESFARQNADRKVQALSLSTVGQIAAFTNDKEKERAIYNELKTKFSDMPEVQFTLSQLNPDKAIQVGNPVPDFEIKLLSGESVSRTSMLGKFYMIDFWAVWCGPCVAEMPKLHEAYEKHKGKKGFTVLSLSFDQSPDDIAKFRTTKFSMPWLHAFVEKGPNNDLSKRFEVMGIPKPILVDDKGNIIATENELRGEDLDKTLAKHLDAPKN
ncbi:MAG: thioredoxin-like domain-containing protein [Chloroherpetonaceae bacterium]